MRNEVKESVDSKIQQTGKLIHFFSGSEFV